MQYVDDERLIQRYTVDMTLSPRTDCDSRVAHSAVMTTVGGISAAEMTFERPETSHMPLIQPTYVLSPLPNALTPLSSFLAAPRGAVTPLPDTLTPVQVVCE